MGILTSINAGNNILLPSEIVAYWKLDEITGKAIDSFAGYNLTETGTVPAGAGIINGSRGVFSADNYFQGSTAAAFYPDLFLIEGWVKTATTDTAQWIFNKTNGINAGYYFIIDNSNYASMNFPGSFTITGTTDICDGDWHYVVFCILDTSGADNARIYVDGVSDNTAVGASYTKATAETIQAGNWSSDTGNYNRGLLDEMAFWNLTGTTKSWADIETIITERYNTGIGKGYSL